MLFRLVPFDIHSSGSKERTILYYYLAEMIINAISVKVTHYESAEKKPFLVFMTERTYKGCIMLVLNV
jgi:hypothetical protein